MVLLGGSQKPQCWPSSDHQITHACVEPKQNTHFCHHGHCTWVVESMPGGCREELALIPAGWIFLATSLSRAFSASDDLPEHLYETQILTFSLRYKRSNLLSFPKILSHCLWYKKYIWPLSLLLGRVNFLSWRSFLLFMRSPLGAR